MEEQKLIELQEESNRLLLGIRTKYEDMEKNRITPGDFKTFEVKINSRLEEIDQALADLKKPNLIGIDQAPEKRMADFRGWLQRSRDIGIAAITGAPEQKVLTIADTTHAGVLAPYEYVKEILKAATIYSPIRSLARIRTTSSYAVEIPTETAVPSVSAVAESSEKTEDTGWTFGLTEIKTFESKMLLKATQKMLEDSAFNLEMEISDLASRRFGVWEGTQFVSGDGTTEPEGFLTNSTVTTAAVETATSNTIAVDDLIGLQYGLSSPYVPNATWVMKRVTVGTLMKLKNATTNGYLLEPQLQKGQPNYLLGSPIVEAVDMPSGLVDNQYEIAYGDFRAGYTIVDRVEVQIQRLVEKYAEFGMIGFLMRRRVGGAVTMAEAIKLLKIKA